MPQESSVTLSRLEQLPPELLLVIFESIRVDTISEQLPQSKAPFSLTLLPYVRRNLYRDIDIRSYSQLLALVRNHSNRQIPSLIQSLSINCGCTCGSSDHHEAQEGTTWNSIKRGDIFSFFVETTNLKSLQIRGPTQLSQLPLRRHFASCTLPALDTLDIVVALDSASMPAEHFKWIARYQLYELRVEFVGEETVIPDQVEGLLEEVEAEGGIESGLKALAIEDADAEEGREGGSGEAVDDVGSEDNESDWEDESDLETSDSNEEEDIVHHNHIGILRLRTILSDTRFVPFIAMFHSLLTLTLSDKGPRNSNFIPLLNAIPPDELLNIEINGKLGSLSPIDAVIPRFRSLHSLQITSIKCTPLLFDNLSTLPNLHMLLIGAFCDPSYDDLAAIIRTGPRKMKNLLLVLDHLVFERGTTYEEAGFDPYVDDEGDFQPYPDWHPPAFTPRFSREDADQLLELADEEGMRLEGNLEEAIEVYDEWVGELIFCEDLQADIEAEYENETYSDEEEKDYDYSDGDEEEEEE